MVPWQEVPHGHSTFVELKWEQHAVGMPSIADAMTRMHRDLQGRWGEPGSAQLKAKGLNPEPSLVTENWVPGGKVNKFPISESVAWLLL